MIKYLFSFLCPLAFLRLNFGGGGGSSSSTTKTENIDKRIAVDSGIGVSGDSNTIQVLDGGAIKNAFDFAGQTAGQSFSFATESNRQALDSLNVTSNLVKDAYADAKGRGALTDKILIGAIAVSGLVALFAIRKRA